MMENIACSTVCTTKIGLSCIYYVIVILVWFLKEFLRVCLTTFNNGLPQRVQARTVNSRLAVPHIELPLVQINVSMKPYCVVQRCNQGEYCLWILEAYGCWHCEIWCECQRNPMHVLMNIFHCLLSSYPGHVSEKVYNTTLALTQQCKNTLHNRS